MVAVDHTPQHRVAAAPSRSYFCALPYVVCLPRNGSHSLVVMARATTHSLPSLNPAV